jgi:hypothetical protein
LLFLTLSFSIFNIFFFAKIFLNSLWDRLTIRSDKSHTAVVNITEAFYELIFSDTREILPFMYFYDDTVWVNWKYKGAFVTPNKSSSPQCGAFTTSHGRLKLLSVISNLKEDEKLLYVDTDSCIVVCNNSVIIYIILEILVSGWFATPNLPEHVINAGIVSTTPCVLIYKHPHHKHRHIKLISGGGYQFYP